MKASVIILTWNGRSYLDACLDAVQAQDYPDFEILVVDNASTDGSADWVSEQYPHVRLIRNALNLGFAAGNNVGLIAATGDVLALLNQDTVVRPGWLRALVEALQTYSGAGVVGAKIFDMDGRTLQHAGGYIQRLLALGRHYGYDEIDAGQWDTAREVEFVTGASLAFKREVYEKIGGLDAGFYPGYFEDVDFCYRARDAGYTVWYAPQSQLLHHESASMRRDALRGHRFYHRNRLRFVFKHYAIADIVMEFLPAETARIAQVQLDELRALAASTLEGILLWAEMAHHRRPLPTAEEYVCVSNALRDLYETVIQHALERGPEPEAIAALLPPAPDMATRNAAGVPGELPGQIANDFSALANLWRVTPRPFASDVPVAGPLIVAFRNMVNNLASRWYVQPILEQQVTFNANVVRLLNTQLQYHIQQVYDQSQRNLNLVEQVAALQQQNLLLASRVSRLEEKLDGHREPNAG